MANETFSQTIDRYALAFDNSMIDCTDPERFGVVVAKVFEISSGRIVVYTDHLCRQSIDIPEARIKAGSPYWANSMVIEAACEFLAQKGSSLEIIVGHKVDSAHGGPDGNEFLRAIVEAENRVGDILLYVCEQGLAGDEILPKPNFLVAEDVYRVETSDVGLKGIARFGSPEPAHKLFETFDGMVAVLDKALASSSQPLPAKLFYRPKDTILHPTVVLPSENAVFSDNYFFDQSCLNLK